jgi:hypothetical protein
LTANALGYKVLGASKRILLLIANAKSQSLVVVFVYVVELFPPWLPERNRRMNATHLNAQLRFWS